MIFSHQLVRHFLFLNCQSAQYLPCTQSNKIDLTALMAKNPRQNHYGLNSGQIMCLLVFISVGNLCFSCSSWIQEQLIPAQRPALTFLMQNDLLCLQRPSGSSCIIALPPGDLQASPRAPRTHTDFLLPYVGLPLHKACSSALSAQTAFKAISDTIGKVLGKPASSGPGKASR